MISLDGSGAARLYPPHPEEGGGSSAAVALEVWPRKTDKQQPRLVPRACLLHQTWGIGIPCAGGTVCFTLQGSRQKNPPKLSNRPKLSPIELAVTTCNKSSTHSQATLPIILSVSPRTHVIARHLWACIHTIFLYGDSN